MDYKNRIESNPKIMLGKPVVKGTRITVELILQKLSDGIEMNELLIAYPNLKKDDLLAAISYSAAVIANEEMIQY